jgi:ABC-type multidrug transport system fused ATPase/permease subunit
MQHLFPFKLPGLKAFKLLAPNHRIKVVQICALAAFLAGLEVLSLTFILPLLQSLIVGSPSHSNRFHLRYLDLSEGSSNWIVILTLIVVIYIFKNVFALWHMHRQSRFLDQLYVSLAEKIYHRFYQQSWTDFTKENSAEAFRKIKNTAYEYTHNVLASILMLLPEALICVLITVLIIWIDYRILFVLSFLFLPILIFYIIFQKKIISKIDKSFRELTPHANIVLAQGIDSFAETKIYGRDHYFIQHFINISKITTRLLSRLKTFINVPSRLVETIGIICFTGIIAYGKMFPETQEYLLIFLVMLSLVIYRIIPSINKILVNLSQVQAYSYAVSELEDILKHENVIQYGSQKVAFTEKIEFKLVSFEYDVKLNPIMKDLSFTIYKGDFLVLEGPSGTGKTTFLHIISCLTTNYRGEIFVDKTLLSPDTYRSWQKKLGFVPQVPIILQDSILQNIAFGVDEKDIVIENVNSALHDAQLTELVNSFALKLHTPIGENGLTLSGGQRQRLALARALYRNPEVLLLDEVTNHMDEVNKTEILSMLKKLCQQRRMTILFASHDLSVRKFATRIIRLDKSKIEEHIVV